MLFSIESIFVVSIFLIINVLYTYYHVPLFFHFCIIFAQSKRHFFFKISNYIRLYSSFFFFFFGEIRQVMLFYRKCELAMSA